MAERRTTNFVPRWMRGKSREELSFLADMPMTGVFSGEFSAPEFPLDIPLTSEMELTIHQTRKKWEFPKDRFVTYEASDEKWARPLGFGREVEITETTLIPRAIVEYEDGVYRVTGALPIPRPAAQGVTQ